MASARSHCPDGGRRTPVAAPGRLECPAAGALVSTYRPRWRVLGGVSGIRGGARTGDDPRITEQGAVPDRESDRRTGEHAAGGPRAAQPLLPLLGRYERSRHHPREFLHDERELRALPYRDLSAVEVVDPSLLVVQQPVVSQVHRVHAGRRRDGAFEVVRGLPRSRGVLQRPLRSPDQGADRHA